MGFSGDLRTIDLANIFQTIAMNQMTGTLHLFGTDEERHIFFENGELAFFSWGREPLWMGRIVVNKGMLPETRFQAISRDLIRGGGRPTFAQFCEAAGIPEPGLRELIQRVIQEQIYEIFGWREARFIFEEGPVQGAYFDADMQSFRFQANWSNLILEAARRLDEWRVIRKWVKSDRDIYVRSEVPGLPDINVYEGYEPEVLAALDGEQAVEDVANRTGLGLFPVSQLTSGWHKENRVRPLSLDELKSKGEAALRGQAFSKGVRFFGRAVQLQPADVSLRLKLIHCLDQEKQWERAAQECVLLAEEKRKEDDLRECVRYLQKALKLFSQNPVAPARLLQALKDLKHDWEVLVEGRRLVKAHRARTQTEAAKGLYERMLEWYPDNGDLREEFAKFLDEEGKREEAIRAYESVADHWTKHRSFRRAQAACEAILLLDPKHDGAKSRLVGIRKILRSRRRRSMIAAGLLAVLCLGEAYIVYTEIYVERVQYAEYQRFLRTDVLRPILLSDWKNPKLFQDGIQALDIFITERPDLHPWVRSQAKDLLASLKGRKSIPPIVEILVAQLREARRKASPAALSGDFQEAAAGLRKVIDRTPRGNPDVDAEIKVAETDLDGYLSKVREFENLQAGWTQDVEDNRLADALRKVHRIRTQFTKMPGAKEALAPVGVDVAPESVTLRVDGKPVTARGTRTKNGMRYVLLWEPKGWMPDEPAVPLTLEAEAAGFRKGTLRIEPKELAAAVEKGQALERSLFLLRNIVWTFPPEKAPDRNWTAIAAPLTIREGRVFALEGRGRIAAFRTDDPPEGESPRLGEGVARTAGEFDKPMMFSGNRVWIPTSQGAIAGFRMEAAERGTIRFEPEPALQMGSLPVGLAGTDAEGRFLAWRRDGRLQFFGPAGAPLWPEPIPSLKKGEAVSLVKRPAFDGKTSTAYFGTAAGEIYAVEAKEKAPEIRRLWGGPGAVDTPLRLQNGVLYFVLRGRLYALDAATGREIWKTEQIDGMPGELAVGARGVFFGTSRGRFYGVSLDGRIRFNLILGAVAENEPIEGEPCLDGTLAYVATRTGWVYSIDLEKGEKVWNFRPWEGAARPEFRTGPVLSGRTLFYAAADGRIQAVQVDAIPVKTP
ncbi:MAG: DUF4388 domain-containing protein [Planctomycetota bacterium]